MTTRFWLEEIQFSDNTKIPLAKDDIVVFVGPNNAGKSATLKEAVELIKSKHSKTKVLKNIKIYREGKESQLLDFIEKNSRKTYAGKDIIYDGFGFGFYQSVGLNRWNSYAEGIDDLFPIFANHLSTEKRLTAANPAQNIRLTTEAMKHPIHFLQKDDLMEQNFSNYFRQAFGKDLIIHHNAGEIVPFYVGDKPTLRNGEDRISFGYLTELEKLDLLNEQGDGMRSFVGVLLNVFVLKYSMIFIDEPEAFLHPPQARLLGKMLAKDLPKDRQLFLATHSESFLKGLLDANVLNLKIVRIQREGNVNRVSVLDSKEINKIWEDSLLRHSNILDGLFHSKVVICESDSDSRFFSAVLSALYDNTGDIAPDILFINCGGKHRIPTAIKALKKLNVPIKVVADFDVLNDTNPLKEIFEDLGGTWNNVQSDWKLVKKEIEQKRPEFLTTDVKKEFDEIISSTKEKIFPKEKINAIQKILKKASAWSEAKEVGKAFIPSGNASQAFDRIQIKFEEKGLLVLEVGELESFVKSLGNHGPKWVSEVLTKDLKMDKELDAARQFVTKFFN